MKLMIGSFGTLGIITEAILKVRPLPEVYAVAVSYHGGIAEAFQTGFLLHDALPLLHLELLSPGVSTPMSREGQFLLAAGTGGNRKDVDYQLDEIRKTAPGAVILEGGDAQKFYRTLRDVELPQLPLKMQISSAARELPACLEAFDLHFRAHVGSGVAQVALAARAGELRRVVRQARGNTRVLSIDPALRGALAVFDQPEPGVMKLMSRLKAAFDPAGIFNPGCFVGGI
jgi:glycolate oxidase FAD binding subunit